MAEGDAPEDGQGILHPEGMRAARDMAAGVVHEVNNILGVIIGNAHLAKRAGADAHSFEKYIGEIRNAAEEGRELMRSLGVLANGYRARPRMLSLNDLIRSTVSGAPIRARLDLSKRDPAVVLDLWLAQDAIGSLIAFMAETNSVDTLRIATRIAGSAVAVTLEDDGCSLDAAELAVLFTPFAKADRRPKTGLRLAKLADLASRHGGRVAASRREPQGLRVVLTLPLAQESSGDGPGMTLPDEGV